MLKIFPLVVLTGLFLRCGVAEKADVAEITVFDYTFDTIYKTYALDMTDRLTGGPDLLVNDTSCEIVYNYCGRGKLVVFDQHSDRFRTFTQFNPDCRKVYAKRTGRGLYVLTRFGALYFYDEETGKAQLQHDFQEDSVLFRLGLDVEQYKPGSSMQVNVPDEVFYFRVMQSFDTDSGTYSGLDNGFPVFCKFNLRTKEIQLFGSQPGFAQHSTYGLNSNLYDLYVGDSILTSSGIDGNIAVINTLTGRTSVTELRSRYDTVPIRPFIFPEDGKNARSLKMKHGILSPLYEPLYYNPYNRLYYRVFHPGMPEYREDGALNTNYDKTCVLMIMDNKFRILDEKILPVKGTHCFSLFPRKDGVAIYLPDLFDFSKERAIYGFLKIHHQ